MFFYGVDKILAGLLLILCRRADRPGAQPRSRARDPRGQEARTLPATVPIFTERMGRRLHPADADPDGGAVLPQQHRQAGGEDWRGGRCGVDRVHHRRALQSSSFSRCSASQYWIVNVATYGTVFIELAYYVPDLAARRRGRTCCAGAIFLHSQFAILMGLLYFSFVMMMGHMAFVRPEWLVAARRVVEAQDRRHGDDLRRPLRILHALDGVVPRLRCARSRSACEISAPIRRRSSRTRSSRRRSISCCPDGRALPGFEAYRYVVLRVPGLWWQIPFFYVPVFSRLIGTPALRLRRRPTAASCPSWLFPPPKPKSRPQQTKPQHEASS